MQLDWTREHPAPSQESDDAHDRLLLALWGYGEEVYAVGGGAAPAVFRRATDGTWHVEPLGALKGDQLWGIWGSAGDDLYVVGDEGVVLHRTRDGWSAETLGRFTLHSVSGVARERVYVCGESGALFCTRDGGASYSRLKTGTKKRLLDVISIGSGALLAVGDDGVILRSDDQGATWHKQRSGSSDAHLLAAWGRDGRHLVVVGQGGTVLRTDDGGGKWTPQQLPTDETLESIVALPDGTLVVLGDAVVCASRDGGTAWALASVPDRVALFDSWVTPSGRLLVCGENGFIASAPC